MNETWTPRQWNPDANQGAPAPYIPVVEGKTQQIYADTLPDFGEDRDGHAVPAGYHNRITVIYDDATGAIGVVTKWRWNDPVCWYVWTPDDLQQRTGYQFEVNLWPWDAVKTVRHELAFYAFAKAHREGTAVGYWAQAQDYETARVAHEEWLATRLAAMQH